MALLFGLSGIFTAKTSYADSSKQTSFGAYKNKVGALEAGLKSGKKVKLLQYADGWGYFVVEEKPHDGDESVIYNSRDKVLDAAKKALENNSYYDSYIIYGFNSNFYYVLNKVDYNQSLGVYKTWEEAKFAGEKALKETPSAHNLNVYEFTGNVYTYTFDVDPSKANNKQEAKEKTQEQTSKENNMSLKERLEESINKSKKTLQGAEFLITRYPNTIKTVRPQLEDLMTKSKKLIEEAEKKLANM